MTGLVKNIWRYRELTASLVKREVLARYKQSVLGPAWAILQPLVLMLTFSFVASFARLPSDGVPLPLFSYTALIPWTMFQNGVMMATPSIVLNAGIIKKIYFPREVLPVGSILVSLFDFVMSFAVLVGLLVWYGRAPGPWVAILPLLVVVQLALGLGVGLLTSALGTFKRDVIFATFFALQMWMYASPVIYPLSAVPARWRTLYLLNPMAGIVSGYRTALLDTGPPDLMALGMAAGSSLLILAGGYTVFKALERWYADVI
ncbi:MAG: ABC transporter permease [Deltaproteobacteria bacterium]|nr:ABC transporter permease [Deltaproteobacteria bacterium]